MTFYRVNIQFPNDTQVCDLPINKTQYIKRIQIQSNSSDLIYPCKPNDTLTTTPYVTSSSTSLMTTTSSTQNSEETESSTPLLRDNNGINWSTESSIEWKAGLSVSEDDMTTQTVENFSNDVQVKIVLTKVSNTEITGSLITDKQYPTPESVTTVKKNTIMIQNTRLANSDESQRTTMPVSTDYIQPNEKTSIDLRSMMKISEYLPIRDIIIFTCMVLAVALMAYEIKRRRKISRQLRSFLFRI
ncbi:hypothetical protein RF11_00276 [Thelohanellus kitauei]|uniref:Uncharacterized protein n=1 Tax=Thelohanellus kitauei TaxID=669202 RepID=A0A0C2MU74_THEKT|nr:hypothetical protein RF11_00276 [Thelohanellus kitauei]